MILKVHEGSPTKPKTEKHIIYRIWFITHIRLVLILESRLCGAKFVSTIGTSRRLQHVDGRHVKETTAWLSAGDSIVERCSLGFVSMMNGNGQTVKVKGKKRKGSRLQNFNLYFRYNLKKKNLQTG